MHVNKYLISPEVDTGVNVAKRKLHHAIERLISIAGSVQPHELETELRDLQKSVEKMHHAAEFVHNNPDPMLQITSAGTIIMQNEAAAAIKYLMVNNVRVSSAMYWANLASNSQQPHQVVYNADNGNAYVFKAVKNSGTNNYSISSYSPGVENTQPATAVYDTISSTFLNDLIDNLHDGILIEDNDHRILLANNKLCTLFSYPHKASTLRGIQCWRITKNAAGLFKQPHTFLQQTRNLIQKKVHTINEIIELKDGRVFKRDFIPLIDHAGGKMGNMWVYNDITQVQATQKAMDEQRTFYENIVNNLPVDIAVLGADHRYRFVSNSTVKNTNIRKWMIGKTDTDYCAFKNLGDSFARNRRNKIESVFKSHKPVQWEEQRLDSNGNLQIHLRVLNPVHDDKGNVTQLLGYGINITETKQIEEQVRLSEKRYRELFHLSPGIILTHNLSGVITSINPAIENLLGYKVEHAIGSMLTSFIPEKDKELFTAYIARVKQLNTTEGVFRIYNKKGRKLYLLYKNAVVKEEGNEPYVIAFAQDITERIRAEKELELARQATEESSKAKERFLANMSHEIRTPMNGIIGIANLLNKTRLDEQQKNYLSLILESANNLIVIINDILDLEKIIAGKLEFETIPFNLTEKVQHVAGSFHYKAEEKDINLSIKNSVPPTLHLLGDPYRLSQILTNLISNAIKFTSNGQVTIEVNHRQEQQDQVVITIIVTDTGMGISPDKLSSIFDPYTQERSEISRKYGGTGLGLAITRNLVEMQGGVLKVQSEPGKGSSFSVSIPFVTTEKPVEKLPLPGSFNLLRNKHILVAEDVEINQFLVKHILKGWGCVVHLVPDGKKALEMASNRHFDAILMDIQMPVMDGIEATQHIRMLADKRKSTIPIIALTANALKGDDTRYIAAGMNDYLTKPFSEKSLYNVLVKAIGHHAIKLNELPEKAVDTTILKNSLMATKPYDLSGLEAMSGNDPSFLPMMAKLFLDTVPAVLNNLNEACESKDWIKVGNLAHKLKPTIDAMNISSLTQIVRLTEQHGRQGIETAELKQKVSQISETLFECIEHLKTDFQL